MEIKTVVEAKGLTKKYADQIVVNGIQFEVYQGECFGILGPNGAGKTTTLKMMYGSSLISSGDLYVLGLNVKQSPRQVKSRIGVVPSFFLKEHELPNEQVPHGISRSLCHQV